MSSSLPHSLVAILGTPGALLLVLAQHSFPQSKCRSSVHPSLKPRYTHYLSISKYQNEKSNIKLKYAVRN